MFLTEIHVSMYQIVICMLTDLRTPRLAPDSDKFEPAEMDESMLEKLKKLEIVDKEGFVPGFHKKSDVVMSYATVKGN